MEHDKVEVEKLPMCDFCRIEDGVENPAQYDGRTIFGRWSSMCDKHFEKYGIGLGLGKGQKLVLAVNEDTNEYRTENKPNREVV